MGMVGGSYGGAIQLVTAAIVHRVDAILPTVSWNNLADAIYPNRTFKTAFDSLILLDLTEVGARVDPSLFPSFLRGALSGTLDPAGVATLSSSGPGDLVSQIAAPTLLIQGTADDLVPLQQAVTNAQLLTASGVPVKMIWFCGGHGACLDPVDQAAQANSHWDQLVWQNQYVK
jgi:ABC-2 type transport system ATP-binding protein